MKKISTLILSFTFCFSVNVMAEEYDTLYNHTDKSAYEVLSSAQYDLNLYSGSGYVWGYEIGINPTSSDGFAQKYYASDTVLIHSIIGVTGWWSGMDHGIVDSFEEISFSVFYSNQSGLPLEVPIASKTIYAYELVNSFAPPGGPTNNFIQLDEPVAVIGEFFVAIEASPYHSAVQDYDGNIYGIMIPDVSTSNISDAEHTAIRLSQNGQFMDNWQSAHLMNNKHYYFPVYPVTTTGAGIGDTNGNGNGDDSIPTIIADNFVEGVDFKLYAVYPNPVNDIMNVKFELNKQESVKVSVYNLQGQLVMQTEPGIKAEGVNTIQVNTQELPSGTYLYVFQTEGNRIGNTFIKQ